MEPSQQEQQLESDLHDIPVSSVETTTNTKKLNMNKRFITALVFFVGIGAVACIYYAFKVLPLNSKINSYEECIKVKGAKLQPTYPEVCVTKDGKRFANETAPTFISLRKSAECYENAVNSECKYGTEECMANPASAFCVCMGGKLEIREKTEGQYGVCVINGQEQEEWNYFRTTAPQEKNTSGNINKRDLDQGWYWGDSWQKKPGTPTNWILSHEGTKSACWHNPSNNCDVWLPFPNEQ